MKYQHRKSEHNQYRIENECYVTSNCVVQVYCTIEGYIWKVQKRNVAPSRLKLTTTITNEVQKSIIELLKMEKNKNIVVDFKKKKNFLTGFQEK